MSNFGKTLRGLRLSNGLTQEDLAKAIKMPTSKKALSKSAISMYENGNREPDFETLEAMADFFNVDMNFLHGRNLENEIHTIAAHHDGDEWTEEELAEIERFKEFVKQKRQGE